MDGMSSSASHLTYLNYLETMVRSGDNSQSDLAELEGGKIATTLLKDYTEAIDELPEDWNDENYIIISFRHALLLLATDEETAGTYLNLIRINCNKAQVFVAMAEYYLKKNDLNGARVCLERARKRNAQPLDLIEKAVEMLSNGARSFKELIDPKYCYHPPDDLDCGEPEASEVKAESGDPEKSKCEEVPLRRESERPQLPNTNTTNIPVFSDGGKSSGPVNTLTKSQGLLERALEEKKCKLSTVKSRRPGTPIVRSGLRHPQGDANSSSQACASYLPKQISGGRQDRLLSDSHPRGVASSYKDFRKEELQERTSRKTSKEEGPQERHQDRVVTHEEEASKSVSADSAASTTNSFEVIPKFCLAGGSLGKKGSSWLSGTSSTSHFFTRAELSSAFTGTSVRDRVKSHKPAHEDVSFTAARAPTLIYDKAGVRLSPPTAFNISEIDVTMMNISTGKSPQKESSFIPSRQCRIPATSIASLPLSVGSCCPSDDSLSTSKDVKPVNACAVNERLSVDKPNENTGTGVLSVKTASLSKDGAIARRALKPLPVECMSYKKEYPDEFATNRSAVSVTNQPNSSVASWRQAPGSRTSLLSVVNTQSGPVTAPSALGDSTRRGRGFPTTRFKSSASQFMPDQQQKQSHAVYRPLGGDSKSANEPSEKQAYHGFGPPPDNSIQRPTNVQTKHASSRGTSIKENKNPLHGVTNEKISTEAHVKSHVPPLPERIPSLKRNPTISTRPFDNKEKISLNENVDKEKIPLSERLVAPSGGKTLDKVRDVVANVKSKFRCRFFENEVLEVNKQPYEIVCTIGFGGSSTVYEAKNAEGGKVAIKMVSFEDADDSIKASYRSEVDMLLRLQDSCRIIRLFDYEIQEDGLALVMECADTDLRNALVHMTGVKPNGAVPPNEAEIFLSADQVLNLWTQLVECVESLHSNGIVHLDLKPGNFVLVNGIPKLIDLGISHSIPEDRTSVTLQHALGTLEYMSPEQFMLRPDPSEDEEKIKMRIGRSSDIWALGCILHKLMFNRSLFRGANLMQRLTQLMSGRQLQIADYPAAPKLVDALKICLQVDHTRRPTATQLLEFIRNNVRIRDTSPVL